MIHVLNYLQNKILPKNLKRISFTILLLVTGCVPVISEQIRKQEKPGITFKEVLEVPDRYKGELIVLSGFIVGAKNTEGGTLLEVLQSPSDSRGKPKDIDKSEGRFLAFDDRHQDSNLYVKGQPITVAGEIQGKRILPLGEMEYTYPVIQIKELYLWPKVRRPHPYSYYSFERYYWWRGSLLRLHQVPRQRGR